MRVLILTLWVAIIIFTGTILTAGEFGIHKEDPNSEPTQDQQYEESYMEDTEDYDGDIDADMGMEETEFAVRKQD